MNLTDVIMAPVFLPLLGAAISFIAKAFLYDKKSKIAEYIGAFIGLGLPWVVLFYLLPFVASGDSIQIVMGNWSDTIGIIYRFDGLAWLVNFLGFSVATAAWIYSLGSGPSGPSFTAMFLIQTAALAATSMTVDLFNLYVCLEIMGIASYILVASSEKPGAFLASFTYLMISATAMLFFIVGLFGLYRLTGSLSYDGIAIGLRQLPHSGGYTGIVSISLIVGAVAMRVAVMPLYGWLPDAHALAPHSISAVLSGVLIKTPLFALYRILIILPGGSNAGELMGYVGGITALAAVIIALSQKDTKRLLAYHSISQIGYIVCVWGAAISIGVNTTIGITLMTAAFLHALYHALFKGLLFLTIGTTTDIAGERDVYKLRGAAKLLFKSGEKFPITFLCYLTGALAIMAIPPLNGYASKAAITYSLKGSWQGIVLFAASIGTTASFIKLTKIYLPGSKRESNSTVAVVTNKNVHISAHIAQIFLATLCIVTGLNAPFVSKFVMGMLSNGTISKVTPSNLFSSANFIKTAIIFVSGLFLYILVSTKHGKQLTKIIRNRPRSFHGLFLAMSLGMAAMALWMIYI